MRKILWLAFLWPTLAMGAQFEQQAGIARRIPEVTVETLPTGIASGTVRIVTDGSTTSDCTVGGGSSRVLCNYNGSAWAAIGDGAGGGSAAAADITFTPAGSIAATDVQAALEELDSEKLTSTSLTLDLAFDGGKSIDGANSAANAMQVGDGTNKWLIYRDSVEGLIIEPSTAANVRQRIQTNMTGGFYDVEGAADILICDPDSIGAGSGACTFQTSYQLGASNLGIEFTESDTNPACAAGNYNIYADSSETALKICNNGTGMSLTKPTKSVFIGAGSLIGDGTQCPAAPTAVTINSGPIVYTFICADNDASTLYGAVHMPDSWDGGTVTFAQSYIQTAADTSALNGDIMAQCRGNGETPSSTWGSEVAIDDAGVTGSNANDWTVSAAVTPAGTCAGGDMLYFRWQMDATGTTTAVATLHFLGFKMEYTVSGTSD